MRLNTGSNCATCTFNLTRFMHLLSYPGLVVSPIDFAALFSCLFPQVSHNSRLGQSTTIVTATYDSRLCKLDRERCSRR